MCGMSVVPSSGSIGPSEQGGFIDSSANRDVAWLAMWAQNVCPRYRSVFPEPREEDNTRSTPKTNCRQDLQRLLGQQLCDFDATGTDSVDP